MCFIRISITLLIYTSQIHFKIKFYIEKKQKNAKEVHADGNYTVIMAISHSILTGKNGYI